MYFSFKLAFGRGCTCDHNKVYLIERNMNVDKTLDPVKFDPAPIENKDWDVSMGGWSIIDSEVEAPEEAGEMLCDEDTDSWLAPGEIEKFEQRLAEGQAKNPT